MSRVYAASVVVIFGVFLAVDWRLLSQYYQKPDRFSLFEGISPLHYFLLDEMGLLFAQAKMVFSLALLVVWIRVLVFPTRITALDHATTIYAAFWAFVGLFVFTGVIGLIQYGAGMPINIFDYRLLVATMPQPWLSWYLICVVGFPLVLVILTKLYKRRANKLWDLTI